MGINFMEYLKQFEPFFDSWVLDEQIGEGSQSKVYRIHSGDQMAAMRVTYISLPNAVSTDEETRRNYARSRVQEEKNTFNTVISLFKDHPNIVQHKKCEVKYQECDAYIFEMLELLHPLKEKMSAGISEVDVVRLGINICSALKECHKHNLIHRDIKPGNIYYDNEQYKLGDFSIATSHAKPGVAGSYSTMAPEVLRGEEYDYRADIYSLGMTLYLLLNDGKMPFSDFAEESAWERASGSKLPEVSSASKQLMSIVLKACEFNPNDRYKSASTLMVALKKVTARTAIITSEDAKWEEDSTHFGPNFGFKKGEASGEATVCFSTNFDGWEEAVSKDKEKHDIFVIHKNVVSWAFFTCMVSVIPLTLYLMCHLFISESTINKNVYTHEIIYLTIVLLTNMMRTIAFGKGRKKQRTILFWFGVVGVVLSVLAFGMFAVLIVSETVGNISIEFGLLWFSIPICVACIIMGYYAEHMEDMAQ